MVITVKLFGDRTDHPISEAIVKLKVDGQTEHCVAEGDGPVNAAIEASRRARRSLLRQGAL